VSADAFNRAFTEVVGLEGKYSHDEHDPGNWTGGAVNKGQLKGTMYGISAAAYPQLDIASLGVAQVKQLYRDDFWDKLKCDTMPDAIGIALFKEGVNMGVSGAAKAFQRSLKVTPDGDIGQMTVGIATSSPPALVLAGFLTECAYAYTQMDAFKTYGKGWLSRVIKTAVEAQLTPQEIAA
jgi:lysozyme family protein